MEPILAKAFHVLIIVMMVTFVVFSLLAASGRFDNWTTHYIRRSVKKPRSLWARLIRRRGESAH